MLTSKQLFWTLTLFGVVFFSSFIHPFHIHPFRAFYHDATALLSVVLVLGCFGLVKKINLRIPASVVLPLGLVVVIGLQLWNEMILFPTDLIFPVVYLLGFALAMVVGATLAGMAGGLEKLCLTLAIGFVATGLLSVGFEQVQLFGLAGMPWVMPLLDLRAMRVYANIGQPNMLALHLCFALASVWWLYLSGRLRASLVLVMAVLFLWGMTLTQSRISWIILPLFLVLCWQPPQGSVPTSKWLLAGLLLLFALMVALTPALLTHFGLVQESALERAGHTSERLILWQQAWRITTLHPWLGVGWFQFGPQQVMLAPLFPQAEYSEYAHELVLELAVSFGWPLTLLILAASLYWMYQCCFRQWQRLPVRFAILIFAALGVHSLVEFPLWYATVLIPFGLLIGALHRPELGEKAFALARGWALSAALAMMVFMLVAAWDYLRVVIGFGAMMREQLGKPVLSGSTVKPELTLYSQFYDYFQVSKIKVEPGISAADVAFLERASIRFCYAPVLQRLALAYVYTSRPNEALQVLFTIERLQTRDYVKTYALWSTFAQQDPVNFAEIFKRMPKPKATPALAAPVP